MKTEQFLAAYSAGRNGTDSFHFNPMFPRFQYSDGVRECAEAGCYWLLDILSTELPQVYRAHPSNNFMVVAVTIDAMAKCVISGTFSDEQEGAPPYRRGVDYTTLPEGTWNFYVSREDGKLMCILPSEY